ncbi:MAG: amidohydrolase family protein [Proteobacteria bacterium]|nr:amidohydrolase family protein [Pseudomonadota bacterium]
MPIIDAQIHLWRKGIGTLPHQTAPYLLEHAIRDMVAAGVDGALIHPPASWDPDSNEQAVEAVQAHPDRFRILAYPPLDRPESPDFIRSWKERPGMLGFRFYFNKPENRRWPVDGTLDWLWPAAEAAGMPLALLAADWLPQLGEIAARHPGLKLMVDHMGTLRGAKGDAAFPNMRQLTALARYPNVAVKLTGGPFYADDAYPFKSLHRHYRAMYDAFGPDRLFWGTDITKMPCSWKQCVTHFQEIDWLSDADKKRIMGDALCDWIGWTR